MHRLSWGKTAVSEGKSKREKALKGSLTLAANRGEISQLNTTHSQDHSAQLPKKCYAGITGKKN